MSLKIRLITMIATFLFLKVVYTSSQSLYIFICATLQESVSDFYWYYSGKDVIDVHGQHNFSKTIEVAKQVFNTLTEYIQVS